MNCPFCNTKMYLKHTKMPSNIFGGTLQLPIYDVTGSIEVYHADTSLYYYLECPSCGNIKSVMDDQNTLKIEINLQEILEQEE